MTKTLIIGYGNSLRGDDGIGWVAGEQLAESLAGPDITVIVRQQLVFELAPEIAHSDRLILIDAAADASPGQIEVRKIEPAGTAVTMESHTLTPAGLLACARQLYGSSPETWLVSVGGESFDSGDRLSLTVAARVPDVLMRVRDLVKA